MNTQNEAKTPQNNKKRAVSLSIDVSSDTVTPPSAKKARPAMLEMREPPSMLDDDDDDVKAPGTPKPSPIEAPLDYAAASRVQRTASAGFESLLEQFASLDFDHSKKEMCPICNKPFALRVFATHVYSCLQILEDAEYAQKLQLKLAEEASRHKAPPPKPVTEVKWRRGDDVPKCFYAGLCRRTDTRHFAEEVHPASHPLAAMTSEQYPDCIVCSKAIPVVLLEAHVNRCLEKSQAASEAAIISAMDADTTDVSMASVREAPGPVPTPARAPSNSWLGAPPAISNTGSIRDSTPSDVMIDEGEGEETKASEAPLTLSTEQVSALSSLAMQVRATNNDKNYMSVLDNFEKLGLTEANLRRMVEERQRGAANGAGPANSNASTDPSPGSGPDKHL